MEDARTDRATEPSPSESGSDGASFPVVGIGASAGGLAAFEAFFSGMPTDGDSGMAFVLVQHLAPDHDSILVDLVRRFTSMEVREVEDGVRVTPNCAYIIPPNRDMALLNGTLQLLEPVAPRGQRLAIDFFFRSLAHDQRERAICVILSGAGSDGTQGLRAIKAEGGMAMAQNPASTDYGSMPSSAIATGLVDYILPPAEMPAQLIAYAKSALRGTKTLRPTSREPKVEDSLKKVLVLLRGHTGHDFSRYKQSTVARRVERRMAVQQLEQPEEYLRFARENPAELDALFGDLLIGVTSFFRDAEAFQVLQQHIALLLASKPAGSLVRVWTTGCSTGEEAYSLAILFREQMDAMKQSFRLQVFATDIDSRSIAIARAGVYSSSIVADVSSERLARFFSQDGDTYRINKNIRDTLVFSEHDLIRDPPFSKLDLISCRNLLIYLSPELQRTLIPVFHYGLNSGGRLFLGSAETVGDFAELFTPLDRKAKLYERLDAEGTTRPALSKFLTRESTPRGASQADPPALREPQLPLRELTERALLARAPVGALVNEWGELLYVHGSTGRYLQPAPGNAGLSIMKMARDGLARQLTSALERAAVENLPVCYPRLTVKTDGAVATVNLTVQPVSAGAATSDDRRLFLVTFEEAAPAPEPASAAERGGHNPTPDADRIEVLTQELRAKDEHLRTVQEEMQTANEELKSSNEELQSTNEELQSTNEELETSKEELQSVNEELATVNSELQAKVLDLSQANNDMNNLLAGTGVGTIFVDHQLCIQRFTPAATLLVNLIRSDVGRPLGHIVSNLLGYDRLVADVQDVLETLTPKEVQVSTRNDAWYLLSIRPYRTLENVIEGAVITFTEITLQKRAQAALLEHETLRRMAAVVRDARDAITVQDLNGRILAWNRCAEALYGWSEAEALNMNVEALIPEGGRAAAAALVRRLAQAEVIEPFRTTRVTKNSSTAQISMTATALVNESGEVYAVCTTERELVPSADA
jgi:two-component system, chemotaxis family, CheB/CheR fusion protein